MSENKKLKLYVNREFTARLSYIPLLFPFWGPILKDATPYLKAALERHNFDKSYYELTGDIDEADFVLTPHNYWYFKEKPHSVFLEKCVEEAQNHNKPLLIDAQGDPCEHINIKNAYVLRTSQYRFRVKENEIMTPAYAEDLLEAYGGGRLEIRKKEDMPTVGFAGWAKAPFLFRMKSLIKEIPLRLISVFDRRRGAMKKGIFFREKAILALKKSKLVKTNFIIRDFFSGHTGTIKGDAKTSRQQFVDNILNSDYVLCVKGDGNFSVRFYETLSLGRIPLFIDTETILPLEDVINYKDFCVFVDFRDLPKIDKILAEFHKNISEEQFVIMQKKARDVFENYLRIDKFTKYLAERLKKVAQDFYK